MSDELHFVDEAVEMTDEQWQRAIDFHRKRMGRQIEKIAPSENEGAKRRMSTKDFAVIEQFAKHLAARLEARQERRPEDVIASEARSFAVHVIQETHRIGKPGAVLSASEVLERMKDYQP